ncbi:hypothetical protein AMECASPLE_021200 [Ameca splendens]|uniref:Uncharacterized protein n=1 Tax=Ameca splendens TaxID=208324 RepID=A0ABV0ZP00_9TELE
MTNLLRLPPLCNCHSLTMLLSPSHPHKVLMQFTDRISKGYLQKSTFCHTALAMLSHSPSLGSIYFDGNTKNWQPELLHSSKKSCHIMSGLFIRPQTDFFFLITWSFANESLK